MKKYLSALILAITFAGFCFASDANNLSAEPNLSQPVLVFGNNILTQTQLSYLKPGFDVKMAGEIADYWLDTQLLYQEALRRGLDRDDKAKFLAELESKKIFARMLVDNVLSEVEVDDAAAQKYYDANKDTDPKLKTPSYLSFSHISVTTIEEANDVLKKLNAGTDINELAKQVSVSRDKDKGGRALKYQLKTVKSRYGDDFAKLLLDANEGDFIGPVKSKKGLYEVVRHEGRRESVQLEFGKVKDAIKSDLKRKAKKSAVDELLQSLRKSAVGKYEKKGILAEKTVALPQVKNKK